MINSTHSSLELSNAAPQTSRYGNLLPEFKSHLKSHFTYICRSVSYGAIGHVLGHELTHGFDTLGKQYMHLIKA